MGQEKGKEGRLEKGSCTFLCCNREEMGALISILALSLRVTRAYGTQLGRAEYSWFG